MARWTGEWDMIQIVSDPDLSARHLIWIYRSWQAALRRPAERVCHQQHRQCQIRVARRATAGAKKGAANNTVRIRLRVDLRKLGRGRREYWQRQCFTVHPAVNHTFCYRQYHPATVAYRLGEKAICVGFARVSLSQYNVKSDHPGTLRRQLVNEDCMYVTRPWKAADLPQALLVDTDDDDISQGCALNERDCPVIKRLIEAEKPVPPQGRSTADNQQQGDQHPFANRRMTQ